LYDELPSDVLGKGNTFFDNASYSQKVLNQMSNVADEFHAFPTSVDGFPATARILSCGSLLKKLKPLYLRYFLKF
jgi:hypothetical protein